MNHVTLSHWMRGRAMAALACAALALPLAGCGSGGSTASNGANGANLPPIDDTRGGTITPSAPTNAVPAPRQGMSTKKKVVLLVGAAALYYLYKKHQAKEANAASAQQGQGIYYLSKNGRVYYRDANHQAHWVTPPTQPIEVPAEEAQSYQGLQGYDQQTTGETDLSRFAPQEAGQGGM